MDLFTKLMLTNLVLYLLALGWWRCFPVKKPTVVLVIGVGVWVVGSAVATGIWLFCAIWVWL